MIPTPTTPAPQAGHTTRTQAAQAKSQLFGAAPALYKALRTLMTALENPMAVQMPKAQLIELARAALAQAEGRA